MEQNPLHISTSQRVVQIKNRRSKQGILEYQVTVNNDEKGKWVTLEDLDTKDQDIINSIEIYDKDHPVRKGRQINLSRRVKEIVGMINDFQEPKYVVKFFGSETLESVNSIYLKRSNKMMLLDFLESNIQFDYSKTTISDPLDTTQPKELEKPNQIPIKDEVKKIEDQRQTLIQIPMSGNVICPSPIMQSHTNRQQAPMPIIKQPEYQYNKAYPPKIVVQLNQIPQIAPTINPQNYYYQQQVPYMMRPPPNMKPNPSQYINFPQLNYPQKQ